MSQAMTTAADEAFKIPSSYSKTNPIAFPIPNHLYIAENVYANNCSMQ
jgi:hypothetical protein